MTAQPGVYVLHVHIYMHPRLSLRFRMQKLADAHFYLECQEGVFSLYWSYFKYMFCTYYLCDVTVLQEYYLRF